MGEAVTVIGNPGWGNTVLDYTMTTGIVSTPRRTLDGRGFVQTSAAVNPGNSDLVGIDLLHAYAYGARPEDKR